MHTMATETRYTLKSRQHHDSPNGLLNSHHHLNTHKPYDNDGGAQRMGFETGMSSRIFNLPFQVSLSC
jgi:hypothetical protein